MLFRAGSEKAVISYGLFNNMSFASSHLKCLRPGLGVAPLSPLLCLAINNEGIIHLVLWKMLINDFQIFTHLHLK